MRRLSLPSLAISLQIACAGTTAPPPEEPPAAVPETPVRFDANPTAQGLSMTLREAGPPSAAFDRPPEVPTAALNDAETAVLLARAPAFDVGDADRQSFALRPGSPPPPVTGEDVQIAFPAPDGAPAPVVDSGPLRVTRHAPDGAVPMAPNLSITFSQPMVAITSQEEASKHVPVILTPTPPGKWRWLGTRTLLFDPDPRFPMATNYTVDVPAGTQSATGGALADATSFTFATPAPTLTDSWPSSGPYAVQPVIRLGFDQAVNPEQVAAKTHLTGNNNSRSALRLATDADLSADAKLGRAWTRSVETPEREVFLIPAEPLAKDTSYTLVVDKDLPSAEGPLTTTSEQTGTFYTYAPLTIVEHHCNWYDQCPPNSGWYIRFNNPLDLDALDTSSIKVDPPVPGLQISSYGDNLSFSGQMAGRTTYTVTLPSALLDKFGQTLGKEQKLTFDVGPAEPSLTGQGEFIVLDPSGSPKMSVFSVNHKSLHVKIAEVQPENWAGWIKFIQKFRWDDATPGPLPGKKVFDGIVKVDGDADRQSETSIDLSPYTNGGHGQFAVLIEPTDQPPERWNRQYVFSWVQATSIGLTAFADARDLTVWTTNLADGKNDPNVAIAITPGDGAATTGADGLGKIALPEASDGPQVLVARQGDDVAILPQDPSWWSSDGGWVHQSELHDLRWYVFDDRGMYRPGEDFRIKGWLRKDDPYVGGDLEALGAGPTKISWVLYSSMRNELAKGETEVSGLGGFEIAATLPKDANLGSASLELSAVDAGAVTGTSFAHALQIQEFRRPEFEVSAAAAPGPHLLGTEATVTVDARYYAGGGLANADVNWYVTATPAAYTPPNHDGWSFGTFVPWWRYYYDPSSSITSTGTLSGKTDAVGTHTVGIHFDGMNPTRPYSVNAQATVMDVNRQAWTSSSSFIVHPSAVYVGLRADYAFIEKGQPIAIDAVATDIDGADQAGTSISVTWARMESSWTKGQWKEEAKDPENCTIRSTDLKTDDTPGSCSFTPTIGGSYRALASVIDAHGRKSETELRVWVSGEELAPSRGLDQQQLTLVPDRQDVQPGDDVRILVQSPFFPAEGVMTIRRSGLVRTERFQMDGPSKTFEIPVTEAEIPNFTVAFDVVGRSPRVGDDGKAIPDAPPQVAFAGGAIAFEVPPKLRSLAVDVHPSVAAAMPGADTSLDVVVTDANGRPVRDAEVAIVVADEAVLALSGYQLPDPLTVFYAARPAGVTSYDNRRSVMLANPLTLQTPQGGAPGAGGASRLRGATGMAPTPTPVTTAMPVADAVAEAAPAPDAAEKSTADLGDMSKVADGFGLLGGDKDEGAARSNAPIAVRTDFSALALFAPDVRTDAAGKATVALKLPDSLTRYRIMVVAAAGDKQFGKGEANITARLPLMVRPSAPRFLNFGDQFELPIVVQNQTDAPMTVDVAVRGTNVVFVDAVEPVLPDLPDVAVSMRGKRVMVPANDRVEVRFPAVTQQAGTARFQAVAVSGDASDAANLELPVWTPATTEAFATYGEIDGGAIAQPVQMPPDVWTQFGGLEVTTSSTQLQALTDAVLYLQQYPFDCNEQIASRLMSVAALRDVLGAFESLDLPPAAVLEKTVDSDLEKLAARQNWDGGFSWWRRGDESWPYLGIHVANAEARAKQKGYTVSPQMWERSRSYLKNIEQYLPDWYSIESKRFLRAYALNVRYQMGDTDLPEAKRLFKEAGLTGLGVDALAWLLPIFDAGGDATDRDAILRHFENNSTETAGNAHFVTSYSDGDQVLLHSDRRADGIILESLITVQPKNELIPKVVRGLLANRVKGRWDNTEDNVFVLLSLDAYFHAFESQTPDFVARVWLGDGSLGDHAFKGRTTERAQMDVPMGYLSEATGPQNLVIQRDGNAGRLYYRVGLRYAPKSLQLDPADDGFAVDRRYEAIDDPSDVKHDADGTWHIALGARVRIRVSMVNESRRYHVALVDPLPAGLEAQNPELAVTGTLPLDPSAAAQPYWFWWSRTWYEHENLRDDRAEAFTSMLWEGVHEYTYVARATTPGRYVVPPSKAEEMYAPETFGRSGTDKVVVE